MSISLNLSGISNEKWESCWYKSFNNNNDYGSNTGLGNHLFQISSCLALAWDNKQEFYCYHIQIWCKTEKIKKDCSIWRNIKTNKIKVDKIIKVGGGYDKKKFKYLPNTKYIGYFQSFKYFDHHRKKIQNFFGPNANDLKYIYSKYKNYLCKKTCSLHVRKGKDFEEIARRWNPEFILQKGYYDKAINFIKDKVELFLVFSDNIPYCKTLFTNENYPNINFVFIRERDFIDLWIISLCNHHITSNSTFSWWGAYLNKSDTKIVIAPNKSVFLEKKDKEILKKTYYFEDWILFDE
tara:strand:+ start:2538 stop:3419 length:882 start_codon:yes stop_codon:yes gene_type:complete